VFGDNAFEVVLASKLEECLAVALDMRAVEDAGSPPTYHATQLDLAFDQWQRSRVAFIRGKQIEGDEDWRVGKRFGAPAEKHGLKKREHFAATVEQVGEVRTTTGVETDNLTIEHRRPGAQRFGQSRALEGFECVPVPRHETAGPILYICESTEAVIFQLKEPRQSSLNSRCIASAGAASTPA
jgi:hypothetical protein